MKLYIDECGDLGFSPKATRFFIVSFLKTYNEWEHNIKIKRLLKKLRKRKKYKHDELKFSKANHEVRTTILKEICKYDCDFGFIILNKNKVHQHLRDDLNLLYRYVVIDPMMEMILPFLEENEKLNVVVDRSISEEKLQHEFNSYVELKGYYYSKTSNRQAPLYRSQIGIDHVDSQREPMPPDSRQPRRGGISKIRKQNPRLPQHHRLQNKERVLAIPLVERDPRPNTPILQPQASLPRTGLTRNSQKSVHNI